MIEWGVILRSFFVFERKGCKENGSKDVDETLAADGGGLVQRVWVCQETVGFFCWEIYCKTTIREFLEYRYPSNRQAKTTTSLTLYDWNHHNDGSYDQI